MTRQGAIKVIYQSIDRYERTGKQEFLKEAKQLIKRYKKMFARQCEQTK